MSVDVADYIVRNEILKVPLRNGTGILRNWNTGSVLHRFRVRQSHDDVVSALRECALDRLWRMNLPRSPLRADEYPCNAYTTG